MQGEGARTGTHDVEDREEASIYALYAVDTEVRVETSLRMLLVLLLVLNGAVRAVGESSNACRDVVVNNVKHAAIGDGLVP